MSLRLKDWLSKLLNFFIKNIISSNSKFHNKFQGKKCFLMGSGRSINYMDLKKLSNVETISCNWNFLHNDHKNLNIIADYVLHPMMLFPLWINPIFKNFEVNKAGSIMKETGKFDCEYPVFLSIYNYPFIKKKNVFFLHHFGQKTANLKYLNLNHKFSMMQNSFLTGIGLAIYFGFSEINLIGFDYLSLRPRLYHFYENDIDMRAENQQINISPAFLNELSKLIKINYIYIFENKSKYFNNISYKEFFKSEEKFQSNIELVDQEKLKLINETKLNFNL